MTPLERAIHVCGGVSGLASAIAVAPSVPSMWKKRGRVPAEYCPAIERETRARAANADDIVTCEQLRDDVAWEVLRMQSNDPAPEPARAEG
jgi:DNA-binding transcriptional regulator YdaS (Cro superfamily)